jgi:hypothetical protein
MSLRLRARSLPASAVLLAAIAAPSVFGGCGGGQSSQPSGDGGTSGDDASSTTSGGDDAGSGADAVGTTQPPATDAGPAPSSCAPPIKAADVSKPTTVVGSGTAASCTEAALSAAVNKGGIITFACGSADTTITLTHALEVPTGLDTVVDGGGTITLDGGGAVRIFHWDHGDYRANDHSLTLQHLTLAHGKAAGTKMYPSHPAPCSSGYYDGAGGAVYMNDGVLDVIDVTFVGNQAANVGPDVGGGAIYLSGCKKAVVVGSTFNGNSGSNAGAIGSLNSELDVYDSTFVSNTATGFGANGDDASKCTFVDPVTKQNQTGSGGNGGAIAIDGGADGTHTFCGVTFKGNVSGKGALGGAIFRTPDIMKQTTVISRSLFDGNSGDAAGALYFHNSTLQIDASTFHGNSANVSGAIQSDGTTWTFTNVTFDGNSSTGVGGTLSLFGGDGALTNCTFADNKAKDFAAAIFGSPNLTIASSLFVNDSAAGSPAQCQVGTIAGDGNIQWPSGDKPCAPSIDFADPKLGSYGDNGGPVPTLMPAAGSPALGKGTTCAPTDARGKARPATGCTAGAVEGSI